MFGNNDKQRVKELEAQVTQLQQRLSASISEQNNLFHRNAALHGEVRALNAALHRKNYSVNRMRDIVRSLRRAEDKPSEVKAKPSKTK